MVLTKETQPEGEPRIEVDATPRNLAKKPKPNLFIGEKKYNMIFRKIPTSGEWKQKIVFPKATENTKYWMNFRPDKIDKRFSKANWMYNTKPGWEDNQFYHRSIDQFVNPVFTLRATTTSNLYKINGQTVAMVDHDNDGGTATVQVYDKVYKGLYNQTTANIWPATKRKFNVTYDLEVLDSAHGFARASIPVYSNVHSHASRTSWSNSIYSLDQNRTAPVEGNGGTIINIIDIECAVNATTNDKAKIAFTVEIVKFGTKDVTMSLPINTFMNCS